MADRRSNVPSPPPAAATRPTPEQPDVQPLKLHAEPDALSEIESDDEFAELDRLYRQALDTVDAVEQELSSAADVLYGSDPEEAESPAPQERPQPRGAASAAQALTFAAPLPEAVEDRSGTEAGDRSLPPQPDGRESAPANDEGTPRLQRGQPDTPSRTAHPAKEQERVTVEQVLEAALFVGGTPLTSKRLCALFRSEFDQDFIEALIDTLNARYALEQRPYEIRFGEGGYRMVLREAYDDVRSRVFGHGPREVTLSQAALEILSLVAYKQPITKDEIEAVGKDTAGNILRQLLRRELICLKRDEKNPKNISYHTTRRFLELFGLTDLSGLPQADELSFK